MNATMTTKEIFITMFLIFLGIVLTRFLPFILFPADKPTPKFVEYLGKVLPFAAIGMLVVYCLKDITPMTYPYGIPELIGVLVTAGMQIVKKNTLLSIASGVVVYMILVQLVFV